MVDNEGVDIYANNALWVDAGQRVVAQRGGKLIVLIYPTADGTLSINGSVVHSFTNTPNMYSGTVQIGSVMVLTNASGVFIISLRGNP